MKKILLEGKEYLYGQGDLPMLIDGSEGSGASLYTISVAAGLRARGAKLLFLCGYPMAEQEFIAQAGPTDEDTLFFTRDRLPEFKVRLAAEEDRIVFVKNAELFDDDLIASVLRRRDVIISGDIEKCAAKDRILSVRYATKILFSGLGADRTPELKRYEALFVAEGRSGVTRLA